LWAASPFSKSSGGLDYKIALCRAVEGVTCQGESVVAAQLLGADCATGWGRPERPQARLLTDNANDGLIVTYSGPACDATKNKTATFQVECDSRQRSGHPNVGTPTTDACTFVVTLQAAEGCPSRSALYYLHAISWGWIFILVLALLALVYFGFGTLFKVLRLGASGVEAIPNSDLWITAAQDIREGAIIVLVKLGLIPAPTAATPQDVYRGLTDFDEF
jgi:Autophagy-related protein 27